MRCELCGKAATMYCESDQARLCWECDEGVHSANFLAEKHTRVLLCQGCHSTTLWKASGQRLGFTFSLCRSCASSPSVSDLLNGVAARSEAFRPMECLNQASKSNSLPTDTSEGNEDRDSERYDSDDDEEDEESEEDCSTEEDEEEGDNQVVPWSPAAMAGCPPPPPATSPSSSEDITNNQRRRTRFRDFIDPCPDSEEESSSSASHPDEDSPERKRSRSELTGVPLRGASPATSTASLESSRSSD